MYHGEFKRYHDNGQLYAHAFFQNDKLHGEFKTYLKNGQLYEHTFYQNGKRHGEYNRYTPIGVLKVRQLWDNGKQIVTNIDLIKITPKDKLCLSLKYGVKWLNPSTTSPLKEPGLLPKLDEKTT
jgi:antitoxin component YwqK of YwqJK toxin-antitoxin module